MESSALDQLRNRKTLSDLVAAELRDRIVSGRLPMGAELNQLALTEELGVNRAAVREAFRQLEASGVIQLTPHHHAVVTTLSETALQDLLEVRCTVESLAARRAAEVLARSRAAEPVQPASAEAAQGEARPDREARPAAADALEAAAQLRRQLQELEGEADGEVWLELDRRFHLGIAGLSGNPLFRIVLEAVRAPVDRLLRTRSGVEPRIGPAQAEHRAILAALLAGDAGRAQDLMREHVLGTQRFLRQRLRDPAPPGPAAAGGAAPGRTRPDAAPAATKE